MTEHDYLRQAQQHALAVAPDPGPERRWNASDDGSLDVDLIYGHTIVGWITLTSRGWQPHWAWAEYSSHRSHDPLVAMQELLDALKEEMEEELPPAEEADRRYLPPPDATLQELCIHLMEECAELAKAASKLARFGPCSFHPDDPEKTTNRMLLIDEFGDVEDAVDRVLKSPLVRPPPEEWDPTGEEPPPVPLPDGFWWERFQDSWEVWKKEPSSSPLAKAMKDWVWKAENGHWRVGTDLLRVGTDLCSNYYSALEACQALVARLETP